MCPHRAMAWQILAEDDRGVDGINLLNLVEKTKGSECELAAHLTYILPRVYAKLKVTG